MDISTADKSAKKGYDSTLFTSLPDSNSITCLICQDVLREPVEFGCPQQHLFCKYCYDHIEANNGCPICRAMPGSCRGREAKAMKRFIESLEIRCQYSEGGCEWKGPTSNLVYHLGSCAYVPSECSNSILGCSFVATRAEVKDHIDKDCPWTFVDCSNGCGTTIAKAQVESHGDVCAFWPCTVMPNCPTKCTKSNLIVHEAWCSDQSNNSEKLKKLNKNLKADLKKIRKNERDNKNSSKPDSTDEPSTTTAAQDQSLSSSSTVKTKSSGDVLTGHVADLRTGDDVDASIKK